MHPHGCASITVLLCAQAAMSAMMFRTFTCESEHPNVTLFLSSSVSVNQLFKTVVTLSFQTRSDRCFTETATCSDSLAANANALAASTSASCDNSGAGLRKGISSTEPRASEPQGTRMCTRPTAPGFFQMNHACMPSSTRIMKANSCLLSHTALIFTHVLHFAAHGSLPS